LQRLTPLVLEGLYSELLASGRRNGGPLSPATVRLTATVLHRALDDAVNAGLLGANPCERARPPRGTKPEMATWNADQLRGFLEAVRGDRFHAAYRLIASTGLRRGEALGARWKDVDLARSRDGGERLERAVQALDGIEEQSRGVQSLMRKLHAGCASQSEGLARLNSALLSAGQATQQASRTADESAAEAEELAQTSSTLEECVTNLTHMMGIGHR
jgi:integrase